jgi:hypothetical protein
VIGEFEMAAAVDLQPHIDRAKTFCLNEKSSHSLDNVFNEGARRCATCVCGSSRVTCRPADLPQIPASRCRATATHRYECASRLCRSCSVVAVNVLGGTDASLWLAVSC